MGNRRLTSTNIGQRNKFQMQDTSSLLRKLLYPYIQKRLNKNGKN
jgi:hypothetical protein